MGKVALRYILKVDSDRKRFVTADGFFKTCRIFFWPAGRAAVVSAPQYSWAADRTAAEDAVMEVGVSVDWINASVVYTSGVNLGWVCVCVWRQAVKYRWWLDSRWSDKVFTHTHTHTHRSLTCRQTWTHTHTHSLHLMSFIVSLICWTCVTDSV